MLLVRVVHCDSVGDCCGECPAGITGIAGIWREATVCRVCSAVCIYAWRYAVWVRPICSNGYVCVRVCVCVCICVECAHRVSVSSVRPGRGRAGGRRAETRLMYAWYERRAESGAFRGHACRQPGRARASGRLDAYVPGRTGTEGGMCACARRVRGARGAAEARARRAGGIASFRAAAIRRARYGGRHARARVPPATPPARSGLSAAGPSQHRSHMAALPAAARRQAAWARTHACGGGQHYAQRAQTPSAQARLVPEGHLPRAADDHTTGHGLHRRAAAELGWRRTLFFFFFSLHARIGAGFFVAGAAARARG